MTIKSVTLKNFRSYEACEFTPCDGVTVLTGRNAQGKTNALEAVYLACAARSHRTRQEREMIRWGAEFASVAVSALRRDGSHEVEVILSAAGRRVIKIAGQKASKTGELMGHITGVLFSPEDLNMIKDGPSERRRFIDMALSQLRPGYFYALQRYARALKQRNELLRRMTYDSLDEWDAQLALAGAEVMRHRRWYCERLNETASEAYSHIALERERLGAEYAPDVREDMLAELRAARETDMRRMTTTVGAHKDDLKVMIDGRDARVFASQGQQRTAALSLRLAEMDVIRNETGEWPVLMLDDVMSELDPERRRRLVTRLDGVQAIITCTDPADLAGANIGAMYLVENSALIEA